MSKARAGRRASGSRFAVRVAASEAPARKPSAPRAWGNHFATVSVFPPWGRARPRRAEPATSSAAEAPGMAPAAAAAPAGASLTRRSPFPTWGQPVSPTPRSVSRPCRRTGEGTGASMIRRTALICSRSPAAGLPKKIDGSVRVGSLALAGADGAYAPQPGHEAHRRRRWQVARTPRQIRCLERPPAGFRSPARRARRYAARHPRPRGAPRKPRPGLPRRPPPTSPPADGSEHPPTIAPVESHRPRRCRLVR